MLKIKVLDRIERKINKECLASNITTGLNGKIVDDERFDLVSDEEIVSGFLFPPQTFFAEGKMAEWKLSLIHI